MTRTAKGSRSDISELERREAALQDAQRDLEARVEKRTAELSEINRNLRAEIAERERAEAALNESEDRYRSLVEVSPYGIVVHVDGIFVFANPAALRTLGAGSANEIVGRPCLDVIHPDYKQVVSERIRTSLDTGRPADPMDQVFVGLDGRVFHVETTATPIQYQGQAAILAVFRDITSRRESEAALRESEERYRRLVEVSPYGIFVNLNGKFAFANPAAAQALGAASPDELLGRNAFDILHPGFREAARGRVRTALETGRSPPRMDQIYVGLDGRAFHVEATTTRIQFRGQDAALAVFRDITERKQAEEALKASEARTAAARAQLVEAIGSMSEGFAWYDADDRLILFNERYRELYAASADLIVEGARFEDIVRKGAERGQYAEAVDRVEEWVRERLEAHRNPKGTVYQRLGDGRWLQIDERKVPGGGTVGLRTDITRLKDLEGQLLRQERLATVGQLTATVSHEMRNPLGTIRNAVDVIKKLVDDEDPHIQRAIALLDRSQVRLDKVIQELLDFTRVQDLNLSKTEIDAWLDGLLDEYELPPGLTLRRKLTSGVSRELDRHRLERALRNVIDNACQAMDLESGDNTKPGDRVLTVASRVVERGLELSVADTGTGVAPEVDAKVFEPLYSTKAFGVGLGLPMVRQVAEQHGGGAEITSEHGRGTEVVLWLPLDPA